MIIYLDGPINAGRSTVGAMLASKLPHAVHIEVDHLRHFADCLTLNQAIPYALSDAAMLAAEWSNRGFHVIVSWPIEPLNHYRLSEATASTGTPLFTFTLLPRLDVALSDRGGRPLSAHEQARIREMYKGMYAGGQAVGVVIDNSDQPPAETAQVILDFIKEWRGHETATLASDPAKELTFTTTDRPTTADQAFLRQRIKEFNDDVSTYHRLARRTGKEPLAVLMRDSDTALVGGFLATTYWGWLDIDQLWVAEGWRGLGHGRALMQMGEEAALTRGCRQAQVKTWDFQARGFYERLGYHVVGQQKEYPPGHTFYWLRKALTGHVS